MPDLSPQQFLPGTENMRPAEPHEQTEAQFHNRPDVMVHGRFMGERRVSEPGLARQLNAIRGVSRGFHSGTEKSAQERVESLGPANQGYSPSPRFFHGRVDPAKMRNQPTPGVWEGPNHNAHPVEYWSHRMKGRDVDQGRAADEGDDWSPDHHNRFYRNDHEDVGSTSAIHSVPESGTPHNFQTWRQSITDANERGDKVPSHVQAVYDATGGHAGPHHVLHPDLNRHLQAAWTPSQERNVPSPSFDTHMFAPFSGSAHWYVADTLTKDNPDLNRGSLG